MTDERVDIDDDIISFEESDDVTDDTRREAFEQLRAFCERLDEDGADRVVVRWIDEQRPVQTDDGATKIESVQQLTLKGAVDGEVDACTVEHLPVRVAKGLLGSFDFEVIERNDNLT